MKLFCIHLALPLIFAASAAAQGTAFNYQGHLSDGTTAASGIYDLRFAIYDASTNGNAAAEPVIQNAVDVRSGLFNVTLDFGPAVFTGSSRWLEISVRTNGGSIFTTLTPRQPLLPTPYAITAANLSGSLGATQLNGVLPSSALAGGYSAILNFNNESNHYAGDGTALRFGGFGYCALPCYWNLNGNAGTSPGVNFLGTLDNTPLEFRVNGQRALRLEPTTNSPNIIGGFDGNLVAPGVVGTTIGGGGFLDAPNLVLTFRDSQVPTFSTIGGGAGNSIIGCAFATVGGGASNVVSKHSLYEYDTVSDTISGGFGNSISEAGGSTIAGGTGNSIAGQDIGNRIHDSTIGGGSANLISTFEEGIEAITIAGGQRNQVAKASHAAIGGGLNNSISLYAAGATISGGLLNSIDQSSGGACISGGSNNSIDRRCTAAVVAGGGGNLVTGSYGTVSGGINNSATDHAFAAGTHAKALHSGSFVWADSTDEDFATTGTNQFLIRASGGVGIGTTLPQAALHVKGGFVVEGAPSIHMETSSFTAGTNNFASGFASTALGYNSAAVGEFSIAAGFSTTATGNRSTAIGGHTQATGLAATSMGSFTEASGSSSTAMGNQTLARGDFSTAMGFNTLASGFGSTAMGSGTTANGDSSIAMGILTSANGLASAAMGDHTIATGNSSFAMGSGSEATNHFTFAGGTRARAEDPGSFVWASGNTNVFPSSTSNRVHFYAAGGLAVEYAGQDQYGRGLKWLVLASQEPGKVINVYNGAYLSEGGAWTDTSDRNAKENFEPVDSKEILERVTNLPLTSWSYRSESNSVRHLGPVAQDFHETFGLGADDKHIAGLDSSGVALAAIQGLSQELKAKQSEMDQLKQRLEALERRLELTRP